ncbi:MAG TPA: hypothetical protein VGN59_14090 [Acidimicrobiia bacterium]
MAGRETVEAASPPRRRASTNELVALGVVLVVAIMLRARPLLELDRFGLMGYDQAAYFAGGRALSLGYLPYRDFVHIQPPGILYFLAPFSVLGSWGFTLAKLTIVGLGALSAALVWWIARQWSGALGALVAGAFYALYRPSVGTHRFLLIEPLVTVSVLGAIAIFPLGDSARPRLRAIVAGCLFAAAIACKFFAVVPIAAFAVTLLVRRESRTRILDAVGGFAATSAVLLGPWLVLAPSNFLTYTISDQSGREQEVGKIQRTVETFWPAGRWPTTLRLPAAILVAAVVLALIVRGWRSRSSVGVLAAAWLAFGTAFLLVTPQYFDHYAELVAPPVAILIGAVLTMPIADISAHRASWARGARVVLAAALVAGAISAVLEPLPKPFLYIRGEYSSNTRVADRFIDDGECVVSDSPEVGLFVPNTVAYAVTGGAPAVDPFAVGVNAGIRAPVPPRSLATFERSLSRCPWFVTPRFWSAKNYPGWTTAMKNWVLTHYEPVGHRTRLEFWRRHR